MHKIIQKRILILMFILLLVFPPIIFRLFCIQILYHDYYKNEAKTLLDRYEETPPKRGNICDRNGIVLSQTRINYEIRFRLKQLRDKETGKINASESISNLAGLLNQNAAEIEDICKIKNTEISRKIQRYIYRNSFLFSVDNVNHHNYLNRSLLSKKLRIEFLKQKHILPIKTKIETFTFNREWVMKNSLNEPIFYIQERKISREITKKAKGKKAKQKEVSILKVYLPAKGKDARKKLRAYKADYLNRPYLLTNNLPQETAIAFSSHKNKWKLFPKKHLFNLHKRWTQTLNQGKIPPSIKSYLKEKFSTKLSRSTKVQQNETSWLLIDKINSRKYTLQPKEKHIEVISEKHTKIVNKYKGFYLYTKPARLYPEKDLAAHILGTVGKIDKEEYAQKEKDYRINDLLGKSGLEKVFEDQLRGSRGSVVGKRRKKGQYLYQEPSKDGMNLILTIDRDLQKIAEQSLDEVIEKSPTATGGAAVFIDIKTGELLVLATSPRYDNNTFSQDYKELRQNPSHPLMNRVIRNKYTMPPGSTFKIITSIALLEENRVSTQNIVYCKGYLHRPNAFRCTHHHADTDINDAIAKSCNIYFYHFGEQLGFPKLRAWGKAFGFGQATGIRGLEGEQKGYLPSLKSWKKRTRENWKKGNTRMFSIGQMLEATPIQVARAMAIVAKGGAIPKLTLVKGFQIPEQIDADKVQPEAEDQDDQILQVSTTSESFIPYTPRKQNLKHIPIHPSTLRIIRKGMVGVVHRNGGTAKRNIQHMLPRGLIIASKTGTSQTGRYNSGKRKPDHAWFAGFAPAYRPRYAFAVFVEFGGYGGTTAAPVSAKVLSHIYR